MGFVPVDDGEQHLALVGPGDRRVHWNGDVPRREAVAIHHRRRLRDKLLNCKIFNILAAPLDGQLF